MAGDLLDSKRRAIIFFIFALLFAAIAGFMFLQKLQELNTGLGEMAEVYVASEAISPRSIITEESLETEELPKKYVSNSHITNLDQIVGKMSRISLNKGDLITTKMVKNLDHEPIGENRLVRIIHGGNVQFEVAPDFQDRIDLVVTREVDGKLETELFMEDVLVASKLTSESDEFIGASVEVSMEDAINLIHTELTAHHIRVLSANSGVYNIPEEPVEDEDTQETEQPTEEDPVEEQPTEEQQTEQSEEQPENEEDAQTEDGSTDEQAS